MELVERWSSSMLQLALPFVRERTVAEEVVQDTWIAVLKGINRFEGRASLRTWVFTILTNQAKTRAARERRSIPFSALQADERAVDPDSFLPAHDGWAGHWAVSPRPVPPDEKLLADEMRRRVVAAIRRLPPNQRAVVTLRDVEGWSAEEVCQVLKHDQAGSRAVPRGAERMTTSDLTCRDFVELVTDYQERELSPRDRIRVEQHLLVCSACTRYEAQMRAVVKVSGALDLDELGPESRRALVDSVERWLAQRE
jgi:RNA polymerase sigma-70 factor (ECF subfamily)